jgi:hypothetical protein
MAMSKNVMPARILEFDHMWIKDLIEIWRNLMKIAPFGGMLIYQNFRKGIFPCDAMLPIS